MRGGIAASPHLIENGVLVGYMQDRLNARLMGVEPTGNGRRESYAHVPLPRMTNTFMLAGEDDPEDILRSVDNGLYAVSFGGGQVDITSGKFVFSASEAYRIEDGKIGAPVKGATLIGNGPDVLTRVSRIGNDLALGIRISGKEFRRGGFDNLESREMVYYIGETGLLNFVDIDVGHCWG